MNDGLKAVKPTETGPYPDAAPFTEWIGITSVSSGQGVVCLRLVQRCGVAHGGVLATLLDSAMARAACTRQGVEPRGAIDLHVQFIQPAEGTLTATGRVVHSQLGLLPR